MATAHVQLLDRVDADVDGIVVELGGRLPRALLARLALERGAPVAVADLLVDLWVDPPAQARATLRAYMSRLRATALGPWLHGGRSGYRLVDDSAVHVDLWRLEDAVRPPLSSDLVQVRSLLSRWRGAPLGGIGEPPFVGAARDRTRRGVDAVRLEGARLDLDAGRHADALVALLELRREHPDDEDLLALVRVAEARADMGERAVVRVRAGQVFGSARVPRRDPDRGPGRQGRVYGVPAPIAKMVGRRDERAALTAALDVARLVTLTGAAGVGKTRLVVDWLGGGAASREEHVWFVGLGGAAATVEATAEVIASATGAPHASVEGVAEHLADRSGILVIDGVDVTSDAVASIASAVLARARGIAILSTSRRELGVPGESVMRLDPLSVSEACELFEARLVPEARAVDSAAVTRLVEVLGRLPLAIEFAAARAASMPLEEVGSSLLRDIGRSAQVGELPLAGALRSSLDLLSADQRDTLHSLAGFRAPFTREAVAAVCGGRSRDVDLDRLVAYSLVSAEERAGEPVFHVAELIRRAALGDAAPDAAWRRRHRAWFGARAALASVALTARGSSAEMLRLRTEWPDITAAFDCSVSDGDKETAATISGGLLWFGVRAGRQQELIAMTRQACALPGAVDVALEAGLFSTRGFLAYQLGSMDEAAEWISAARERAERSDDHALRGLAAAFSAYLLTLSPTPSRHPTHEVEAALERIDRMPDAAAAMVLLITGQVQRASGRSQAAVDLLERAGALASRCGHEWVALMAPVIAAKVHLDLRHGAPAVATLLPVIRRAAAHDDPVSLLIAVSVAAGAAAALGADATGAQIIGAVDAIGRRYGFDPRANEPADFELYRRRVREGLTEAEWRTEYVSGLRREPGELVELVLGLATLR